MLAYASKCSRIVNRNSICLRLHFWLLNNCSAFVTNMFAAKLWIYQRYPSIEHTMYVQRPYNIMLRWIFLDYGINCVTMWISVYLLFAWDLKKLSKIPLNSMNVWANEWYQNTFNCIIIHSILIILHGPMDAHELLGASFEYNALKINAKGNSFKLV